MKKLSLVIPCFNEESTLERIVDEVLKLKSDSLDLELVIVDDCSKDRSRHVAEDLARKHTEIKLCHHERNRGKGAALRTGFMAATGDVIGVQDADLEYDPQDYLRLLKMMDDETVGVAFGSRYLPMEGRQSLRYWHTKMNQMLTLFSNFCSDLTLTDMETCYKLFRADVLRKLAPMLKEERFGFEPEAVARVARMFRAGEIRVVESPIDYRPRSFASGKKIGWKDGVRALWCILKYNFFGG